MRSAEYIVLTAWTVLNGVNSLLNHRNAVANEKNAKANLALVQDIRRIEQLRQIGNHGDER